MFLIKDASLLFFNDMAANIYETLNDENLNVDEIDMFNLKSKFPLITRQGSKNATITTNLKTNKTGTIIINKSTNINAPKRYISENFAIPMKERELDSLIKKKKKI